MSTLWRRWRRHAYAVLVPAISGCAVRDLPEGTKDCDFSCDEQCPPGFACQAGYCVHPGFQGSCRPPMEDGPLVTVPQPILPEGCPGGAGSLTLAPVEPIRACVGQEVDVALEVKGGTGPFKWFGKPDIPGLTLEQDESSLARLRGTLRKAESFDFTGGVKNDTNCTSFQLHVEVAATAEISTVFPDACPGQPFELELSAQGGDASSYHWAVEGVPELELGGARLSGRAPSEAGDRPVRLSLRDDHCPALGQQPVTSALVWHIKERNECPQAATTALPAPCRGIAYSEALAARDGSGLGYVWKQIGGSLPDGLEFDAEHALVHGTPTGATRTGSLELLLTDSGGQAAVQELDLSLRSECWLAVAGGEPARLHVRDVFAMSDLVLPLAMAEGEAVRDLKFSPDGAWLAFRAGPPASARLYLYPLQGERPPDAVAVAFACPSGPCAVLDYAWSTASSAIAVVLSGTAPEQDYVSGVSLAELPRTWPVVATALLGGTSRPLDYLRDLTWGPEGSFGFVGSSDDDNAPETVYAASEGLSAPPSAQALLSRELHLRASASGWIVPSGFTYSTTAITLPSGDANDYATAWTSPSGLFAAGASESEDPALELFSLDGPDPLAASAAGTCPMVAAWAPAPNGSERILCSRGGYLEPNGEGLTIFDYDPARRRFELESGRALPANSLYQPAPLSNTRRMFSPAGDWLLFGKTGNVAFLQQVPTGTTSLPAQLGELSIGGAAELRFAPDGRALFIYTEHGLRREPIPLGPGGAALSGDVTSPNLFTCEEAPWVSPDNWCGAPETLSHFTVSGDSQAVLFEDGSGGLWLSDQSAVPQRAAQQVTERLAPCAPACAGVTYAFQP